MLINLNILFLQNIIRSLRKLASPTIESVNCMLPAPDPLKESGSRLELKNILPVKINNNILRSETAAISLISIINFNLLS